MQENDFRKYQDNEYQNLNITAQYVNDEYKHPIPIPQNTNPMPMMAPPDLKYCKFCGSLIARDSVVCIHCGRQVEELKVSQPQMQGITINNSATANPIINTPAQNLHQNTNTIVVNNMHAKDKWVSFFLCLFLGFLGAHKFYEGKFIFGILYIFTFGIFGIGVLADLILILLKPNPYYV